MKQKEQTHASRHPGLSDVTASSANGLGQTEMEELLQLQRVILEAIAFGDNCRDILNRLCHLLEQIVPDAVASVMLLNRGDGLLYVEAGPSLPQAVRKHFNGLKPALGYGACGTAVFSGEPVFVTDALSDHRCAHIHKVAGEFGIGASWSTPLVSNNNELSGAVGIISSVKRFATPFHTRLLQTASSLAGLALQKSEHDHRRQDEAERLRWLTDTLPGAVFQAHLSPNESRHFDLVSRGVSDLWGISSAHLQQSPELAWDKILPLDRSALRAKLNASAQNRTPYTHAYRIKAENGQIKWLQEHAQTEIRISTGEVVWNGVIIDITQRREAEAQRELWATAFLSTAEGAMITDSRGLISDVNPAFSRITGYSRAEARGNSPKLLRSGHHDDAFYKDMWSRLKANGNWQGEIWNRRKCGNTYPEWLSITQILDTNKNITGYVGIFADLEPIKESERQLLHLAHHDPLTDLPNRLLFNDRLGHAIERATRESTNLAVLFLDLDRFKNVNDSLGHNAGDQLLLETAARLRACTRQEDTVARLAGDEFTLVLENLSSPAGAGKVAAKILKALEWPFQLEGREVYLSASIGISIFPQDGKDANRLLKNADAAMYQAKEMGRNNYTFYTSEFTTIVEERFELENCLRTALERNELRLSYQPQTQARDQRIIGAEVSVHWLHPERGIIPAERFIPAAEDTGLIRPIGEWTLRTACAEAKHWQSLGLPKIPIAVRLSAQQITHQCIHDTIVPILDETRLAPRYLMLAVTEDFILNHAAQSLASLERLKHLGVSLAIDNFGTGFSSLGFLKRLPVRVLKIGRSLIDKLPGDPNDEAIARAVIALGHSLDLSVIAEGISSEPQREILIREGCDCLQGALFGDPVPAENFTQLLRKDASRRGRESPLSV